MDKLFLTILNMSFTGAFVVAVICLVRLSLKKVPKIISYCLWAVAGFKLAFPLSIESMFSLIPFKAQTIPADIATQAVWRLDSGLPFVDNAVGNILPSTPANLAAGINPWQVWMAVGARVWLAGAAILLLCGLVFYFRLHYKLGSAIRIKGNLYETDAIQSPFVLGVLKPKIYLPLDLMEQERAYIILHEQTHIRRRDHLIKFAAYFILCLHWFNPLAWAAFLLMSVDMEMSCDECVLRQLGGAIKKDYSLSLLSLATQKRAISVSPLAFGEDGVKRRIKNVLRFKKSSRIAVGLAIVFVTLLSLGLMGSRAINGESTEMPAMEALSSAINAENTYIITDYYNTEDGKFSALGLTLAGEEYERRLTVNSGDIIVVDNTRYQVTAESLTLSFYTQPSLEQVIKLWTATMDSWAENDKVQAIN